MTSAGAVVPFLPPQSASVGLDFQTTPGDRSDAATSGTSASASRRHSWPRQFDNRDGFWFTRIPTPPTAAIAQVRSRPPSVSYGLSDLATPLEEKPLALDEPADGPGSILGSAVSLVSCCAGTGLLSLPFAFACAGLVEGLVLLGFFAAWSATASYLICQCCEWGRSFSYEGIMVAAFPGAGGVAMELVVVWLLLGAMTSLLVVAGDALEGLAALNFSTGMSWQPSRGLLIVLDVVALALPLSWTESAYALRHSNTIAVSCTGLVMVILMARGVLSEGGFDLAEISQGSPLRGIPVIMLSLGCQVQVPAVYAELSGRSLHRMQQVLAMVAGMCLCLYAAIAVAGLMVASGQCVGTCSVVVPGNVLNAFPASDTSGLAMRSIMAIAVTLVYPMLCLPCRSTFNHLLHGDRTFEDGKCETARRALLTLLIAGLTVLLATQDTNLASVFGLTGATAGSLICYILPPACYLRLRQSQPKEERDATVGCTVMCWLMIVAMVPLAASATWSSFHT